MYIGYWTLNKYYYIIIIIPGLIESTSPHHHMCILMFYGTSYPEGEEVKYIPISKRFSRMININGELIKDILVKEILLYSFLLVWMILSIFYDH